MKSARSIILSAALLLTYGGLAGWSADARVKGVQSAGASEARVAASPGQIATGKAIFEGKAKQGTCSVCHGPTGAGTGMGPSLKSGKWRWGDGSVPSLAKVIKQGVPSPVEFDGAMPPSGGAALSQADINAVAAYVASLNRK